MIFVITIKVPYLAHISFMASLLRTSDNVRVVITFETKQVLINNKKH